VAGNPDQWHSFHGPKCKEGVQPADLGAAERIRTAPTEFGACKGDGQNQVYCAYGTGAASWPGSLPGLLRPISA